MSKRESNTKTFSDGQVLGIDNDGCLIQWDSNKGERYNCGETLNQFGIKNLSDKEKKTLNRGF
jgi:hypothetical protein